MPVVNWLIAQVGVFGVLGGLFVATYGAFMLWYRDLIDSAEERRAFIESLSADTYLTRYRALLTGVLDWADHAMAQWEIRVRELDLAGVSDARATKIRGAMVCWTSRCWLRSCGMAGSRWAH